MTSDDIAPAKQVLPEHGAQLLPAVQLDSYNLEIKDEDGFIGDAASTRAFRENLDEWRDLFPDKQDPLGEGPSAEIGKRKLDKVLVDGSVEAAGVVASAVEDFAQNLARVIRRFMKRKDWRDTERIAIGGGLRRSRIGEIAIGRAAMLLKKEGIETELRPIRADPDEAGLIGAAHLMPSWLFSGHDAILALDLGGTNFRAGLVSLQTAKAADLSKAEVLTSDLWRHRDDKPSRAKAVKRLVSMLEKLIAEAKTKKLSLAPFIGIGCPGLVNDAGGIERGAQNLPGDWNAKDFHLPTAIRDAIPRIGEHDTVVLLHNDAVVQGLSEVPFMADVAHWGVLTIGTGLGNACFTNREREK
jgi:predicted NBD/HSP70 family sugar kinase